MKTYSNHSIAKGLQKFAAFTLAAGMSFSALAAELWVEPGKKLRGSEYENWATTGDGEAHFSFGVPADFVTFESAKIVFIAKADKEMTYDLDVAVSYSAPLEGNPQPVGPIDSYTAQALDIESDGIVKDYIHELDLSDTRIPSDIRTPLGALQSGDYMTIKFKLDPKGDVKIMGLRFGYSSEALSCEETGDC